MYRPKVVYIYDASLSIFFNLLCTLIHIILTTSLCILIMHHICHIFSAYIIVPVSSYDL